MTYNSYDHNKLEPVSLYLGAEKEVNGLFTDVRIDPNTIPDGKHCYSLRHGDDWGFPVTIENWNVIVNFFGTLILDQPLDFPTGSNIIGIGDFTYTDSDY